jgi:hypothetical protein
MESMTSFRRCQGKCEPWRRDVLYDTTVTRLVQRVNCIKRQSRDRIRCSLHGPDFSP